jgi:hypothetical protein
VVHALSPVVPYLRGAPPGLPFRWSVATLRAGLNFTLITQLGAIGAPNCTGIGYRRSPSPRLAGADDNR